MHVCGIIPDAILEAEEGDVLVVAGQGFCAGSCWGDHRSICANMKGLEGIVIDGAFRDLDGCREADFPIFARNVTPGSAGKAREGELNVPIICGGVEVHPSDLIIGDCNGILVIKPEDAEWIMAKADEKINAEKHTIQRMKKNKEISIEMVDNGLGVTFVFGTDWKINEEKSRRIPVYDSSGSPVARNVWMMFSDRCFQSPDIMDFISLVEELYQTNV